MTAVFVIIPDILGQQAVKMDFVQNDDVIEQLSPYRQLSFPKTISACSEGRLTSDLENKLGLTVIVHLPTRINLKVE
jgi:hypothetical protein